MISARSYAKVNIFLRVTEKRTDGYHNIQTLFAKTGLFDLITVEEDDNFSITSDKTWVPSDSSNIVWKVYDILKKDYSLASGINVSIVKNIPAGGGLGGGSGNAAVFLNLADELFGMGLSYDDKHRIMSRVGSDTAYFLHDSPMFAEGRGEILSDGPKLPSCYMLLVNPGMHVSTPEIYRDKNLKLTHPEDLSRMPLVVGYRGLINMLENTMEPVVFGKYPAVGRLKRLLLDNGADGALMSGSGSTLFGLFSNSAKLDKAHDTFRSIFPKYMIYKTYLRGEA
ncbi:4-(cytidine 5'-diphospho)-2-C-methyl-D-erythritol kinase [Limisalsivibrio acetivorans]|uniref:4-(cytidine 5'-diphospho)-2-C-methyl-D-erythritol kinase n=1 Tax=Limisalsivibrio acetivorans TaxID=1304888 RepID=UPI0003B3C62D|nr:4-(cytidine 5'-diphospho)-2-C-methyl-D-erythritol kinase [Limisalsivibrio acetivorans]